MRMHSRASVHAHTSTLARSQMATRCRGSVPMSGAHFYAHAHTNTYTDVYTHVMPSSVLLQGFRGAFPWAANYDSWNNNNTLATYTCVCERHAWPCPCHMQHTAAHRAGRAAPRRTTPHRTAQTHASTGTWHVGSAASRCILTISIDNKKANLGHLAFAPYCALAAAANKSCLLDASPQYLPQL